MPLYRARSYQPPVKTFTSESNRVVMATTTDFGINLCSIGTLNREQARYIDREENNAYNILLLAEPSRVKPSDTATSNDSTIAIYRLFNVVNHYTNSTPPPLYNLFFSRKNSLRIFIRQNMSCVDIYPTRSFSLFCSANHTKAYRLETFLFSREIWQGHEFTVR